MRRIIVLFLTLLLLWALVGRLDDALGPAHVYVFAGGLFVTYAPLLLTLPEGLAATLLIGAVCEAWWPVPAAGWAFSFGTLMLFFAVVHVILHAARERLPHETPLERTGIALLANTVLFLAVSFVWSGGIPHSGEWPRLASDLVCSEIFVAPAAPWFFALQESALRFVPREPERLF